MIQLDNDTDGIIVIYGNI